MKQKLMNILRALISISLLAGLLYIMRDDLPQICSAMKHADGLWLFYGFSAYMAALYFVAERLRRVLSVQDISLGIGEALNLTFIGYFFNNFLPTSFGGDVIKAYYAGAKTGKKAGAFAGVFMDRVLAMIPFTLIPVIVISFFYRGISNKAIVFMVYIIFCVSIIFIRMLLHKKTAKYLAFIIEPFKEKFWYDKIRSGYYFLNLYAGKKTVLLWSFLLSIMAQVLSIIGTYFFAKAIGVDSTGIGIFFVVVPIVCIITLMPSLNGLGVREGAFVYLFSPYMPSDKAFIISILVLTNLLFYSLIGGLIYSFKKNTFRLKKEGI